MNGMKYNTVIMAEKSNVAKTFFSATLFSGILTLLLLLGACKPSPTVEATEELLGLFSEVSGDTLYALFRPESSLGAVEIPAELLREAVSDSLIALINPENDSSATIWQAQVRFAWDPQHIACLITSETYWWMHGGLLFYDKKQRRFSGAFPVSLLFGGDGSQLMKESLIVDVDKDGDRDIVTYELLHSLYMQEDEPIDSNERHVQLHTWTGSGFQSAVPVDSLLWMRIYEIDW
jgi:hypothetical protein